MCNKEHLVGYLYDELDAADRVAFETHLAGCTDCRQEIAAMRETRQHLASWAPPQPEFNFHIVRGAGPAAAPVARRRFAFVPQWAPAAAASIVLLAGALAITRLEVRYGADGLVVRSGWGQPSPAAQVTTPQPPAAAAPAAQAVPASASSEQLTAQVQALQRRLKELEEAQRAQLARTAASIPAGVTVPELRKILAESESRQRTELALQVSQIWQDFNAARVSDFARLQDVVGRAQGLTNQQLRQHRDSIESLSYRVSAQR